LFTIFIFGAAASDEKESINWYNLDPAQEDNLEQTMFQYTQHCVKDHVEENDNFRKCIEQQLGITIPQSQVFKLELLPGCVKISTNFKFDLGKFINKDAFSAIGNHDMIAKYLSNLDLYFLLQTSKSMSKFVRPEFMEDRKKKKEQPLKELFLDDDFNAFIEFARKESLDYLEIEIPAKSLKSFNCFMFDDFREKFPAIQIKRLHSKIADSLEIVMKGCSEQNLAKKNETLKFKFYFRKDLKCDENHHVIFLGQTFEFKDLSFTLFTGVGPWKKTFEFNAEIIITPQTTYNFDNFENKYQYKTQECFKSTSADRVTMVEKTGVNFKFKFHTFQVNNYTFDKPINNFESSINNCDNLSSNLFQNDLSPKKERYEQRQYYPYYYNFYTGQQQQRSPVKYSKK